MKNDSLVSTRPDAALAPTQPADLSAAWQRVIRRRSFLRNMGLTGAAVPAGSLLAQNNSQTAGKPTPGDIAILRFLAAAEIIESDLWSQYAELGGADGGNPAYIAALQNLDGDMPQYISDNRDDEVSHAAFLNAYLKSKGAEPVNLDHFRTLDGSKAKGSTGIKRLTNLMRLNVDTSWYFRYRSADNPDLGATFGQPITINNQPAIPLNDQDTPPNTAVPNPVPPGDRDANRIQAIANTAGFHFAFIEQGGSSLYTTMALKVTDLEALRIVVSIGGVEVDHFSLWHDKVGNAVSPTLAGVTDPVTHLHFPDFNMNPNKFLFQTNLILPEPCDFLSKNLPKCSVIRPTQNSGALAAVQAFVGDQLFYGQPTEFIRTITALATAADAARRQTIGGDD